MKRLMVILLGCLFLFVIGCGGSTPAVEATAAEDISDEAVDEEMAGEDETLEEEGIGDEEAAPATEEGTEETTEEEAVE